MTKKKLARRSITPPLRLLLPDAFSGERPIRTVVIGAGGTGSQFLDGLASLHVTLNALGHAGFDVTVYDGDRVSRANVGRQRFTEGDIGLNKATILVHRLRNFYGVPWTAREEHAEPYHVGASLIVTAVDSARFRARLGAQQPRHSHDAQLWLDMGNETNHGQVVIGHYGPVGADRLRVPNVYDLWGEELATLNEQNTPSCSVEEAVRAQAWPVNRAVATAALDLLWSLIRHGALDSHGVRFQLNPLRTVPMPIDPLAWAALYGYDPSARMRAA